MKTLLATTIVLVWTALLAPVIAQEKPSQKAFKGIELYSWKGENEQWMFALLPGTNWDGAGEKINRLKKDKRILSVTELEKHFLRLAEGEHVFWLNDQAGASYPPEKLVSEIEAAAKKAKVTLSVPAKDARKPNKKALTNR